MGFVSSMMLYSIVQQAQVTRLRSQLAMNSMELLFAQATVIYPTIYSHSTLFHEINLRGTREALLLVAHVN